MSKITSWDRYTYKPDDNHPCPHTSGCKSSTYHSRCRVVLWPEGAPDPSTVPHAGEEVRHLDDGADLKVATGIPEQGLRSGRWYLGVTGGAHTKPFLVEIGTLTRIPDAPTIEVGGNRYRERDVIARCAELEEV